MNRADEIGWCHYTWNPFSGCLNTCPYCYARKMAFRLRGRFGYPQDEPFRPTFHPDKLDQPLKRKKPARIFVCSMGEIFDAPGYWKLIEDIIAIAKKCPRHRFLFLSSKPAHYGDFAWPENCWWGATITGRDRFDYSRAEAISSYSRRGKTFVSFEPFLEARPALMLNLQVSWFIIGPLSKGRTTIQPKPEWVTYILDCADANSIPVYMKKNLIWKPRRQEFPKELEV